MKKKFCYIVIFLILGLLFLLLYIKISNLSAKVERIERYSFQNERIVFLGDSITSRYDLEHYYKDHYIINSGIGGNLTTDILSDMKNRVYNYNPSKLFLLIGTNDLVYSNLNNEEIKENIEKIIDEIKKNNPHTKIYLQSIYPINRNVNLAIVESRTNKQIKALNSKIKDICQNYKCTYINVYDKLIDRKGNLKRIYTVDGIHLSKLGYYKVTKVLKKYL